MLIGELADAVGLPTRTVRLHERQGLLCDFDAVGRWRFDSAGRVVGIAGLSIVPTRHRFDLDGTIRWTRCTLAAIGILGTPATPCNPTADVPDTDLRLTVPFGVAGPEPGDAVVFITDAYGCDSVVDTSLAAGRFSGSNPARTVAATS